FRSQVEAESPLDEVPYLVPFGALAGIIRHGHYHRVRYGVQFLPEPPVYLSEHLLVGDYHSVSLVGEGLLELRLVRRIVRGDRVLYAGQPHPHDQGRVSEHEYLRFHQTTTSVARTSLSDMRNSLPLAIFLRLLTSSSFSSRMPSITPTESMDLAKACAFCEAMLLSSDASSSGRLMPSLASSLGNLFLSILSVAERSLASMSFASVCSGIVPPRIRLFLILSVLMLCLFNLSIIMTFFASASPFRVFLMASISFPPTCSRVLSM